MKNASVSKRKQFWKRLLYLKERKIQHHEKWLLKKTSVPKRKHVWKTLMYLKETKKWTLVKKSSVPKIKHFLEREKKKQKPTFEQILATSVPKKEKGTLLKKKAPVPKRNNTNLCNRKEKTLKITTYFCT